MHADLPPVALVLPFAAIQRGDLPRVGGKGANLGELASAGFPVPPGFCVTTEAYHRFLAGIAELEARFAALDALSGEDVEAARQAATAMREALGRGPVPEEVRAAALSALAEAGVEAAYAVRSSATAEDLPGASFAGQQDTYLNIRGPEAVIDAIRRCWISLFTDRAVLYRARGGFGHRAVGLSVVVQRMVRPEASGILFTADPISGRRGILTIDAGFGLGEALVSGLVSADLYKVDRRSGALRDLKVGDKAIAIRPLPEGGTVQERLDEQTRHARVLSDAQVAELARVGAAIEAHYGGVPQDVEWCLEGGAVYIVQARPITSLFPLPRPPGDGHEHVYLHFGHVQMMTDPMSPMGRDIWRLLLPLGKARLDWPESSVVLDAASRLLLDATPVLRIPMARARLMQILGTIYAPAADLLRAWAARPEQRALEVRHPPGSVVRVLLPFLSRVVFRTIDAAFFASTEGRPERLTARLDALVEEFRRDLNAQGAGPARLRVAMTGLSELLPRVLPIFGPHLISAIVGQRWLERRLAGRADPEDLTALGRGLIGNVTTEMDLEVADLADLLRGRPELAAALQALPRGASVAPLASEPSGPEFLAAFDAFLKRYGMRAASEIDIARPRWRDDPGLVLGAVLGNLFAGGDPGAHRTRQRAQAERAEQAIPRLQRTVSGGLLGWWRRWLVGRLARVTRAGLALREHPKFAMIRILDQVRSLLLELAAPLVRAGRLSAPDDVFHLFLPELLEALEGGGDLRDLVRSRREAMARDAHLNPPLVMTSAGEILTPPLPKDLPPGAMAGVAASAGVVEGTAHVVRDPTREVLASGEILVAPFTDPGWTPLFVHAAGLVTEVGGLMTHGSVVAREYGIPAVVSVVGATTKIKTGDRLRVDGTRGIVELLAD